MKLGFFYLYFRSHASFGNIYIYIYIILLIAKLENVIFNSFASNCLNSIITGTCLIEYCRSVTIVTNPQRGFFNPQQTHFHRQAPSFESLFRQKNVPNILLQCTVKMYSKYTFVTEIPVNTRPTIYTYSRCRL